MKKIFFILGLLFVAVIAFADYNNYPPMADKYLMPDGSIKTFSGVVVAPPDAGRATKYKTMDMTAAKWLMPDGSLVSALPFSGGGAANVTGLTLGTNATLTVADSVAANITAPFGSGAFAPAYDGTGVNITATSANITTLTAATANITGGNVTGITNLSASNITGITVESVASFSWDGAGSAVTAGTQRCKVIRYPSTLTGWTLDASNAATTVIGLYIGTPNADGTHVSTDATGAANITATTASYAISRDLSGWGTNVTIGANTEICANALSTTATWMGVVLHGVR